MESFSKAVVGTDCRIKVLHLIDQYRTGGPGKTIINTAKYIDESKFMVHVGLFISEAPTNSEFIGRIRGEGISHLLLADKRGICLSNLRKLIKYIRKEGIKIIHTHGYKTDIHGVILKIMLRNIYLVTTHHGWITNTLSQRLFAHLDLFTTVFFDGITVVAESLLSKLPWLTRKTRKCMVIHNGLVIADYASNNHRQAIREKCSISKKEIVFGVFGRLSPEKGCLEMLEAFKLLRKDIEGVRLIYVGEGPLQKNLQEKISQSNLETTVILAGYHPQIKPLYDAIDVLVCPSKTEGLSNVILEAFAYHKPVVATRVGGNGEIITDRHDGLLVDAGDTLALKNALLILVENPELRSSLGYEGYATLLKRFDFKDRTSAEERFYLSVLHKTP